MNFNNGLFSSGTADNYFKYGRNNEHSQGQSSSTSTTHQSKPISTRTPRPLGLKRTTSNSNYPVKQDEVSTSTIHNDRLRNYSSGMTNIYQTDESPTTLTKTPTYEYYGFVLYLSSFIAFVIYLLWAYLPDEILISLGITYFPDRYWALALPVWSFVRYVPAKFHEINKHLINSFMKSLDDHANIGQNLSQLSGITDDFVPELHDIPIGIVNACLYQNVDGLGLWEEEEKNGNDGNIDISNKSTIERQERIESDSKSKI
ncbi:16021_t:CDS:2 [Funneliformis mosseae]|uniref:16021_t:CDS:1 n=1 Tax=Funneliformis mosseae TaxID=27381 RepID=A0A9N8WNY9_FUNMO|nr:16021_t:CDS:2 [Funneliformis mosseae]